MQRRLLKLAPFLVLVVSIMFSGFSNQARAVEMYSLISSPSRILESTSSGVTVTISVNNALYSPPTPYVFSWSVTDPSGTSRSATSNVVSTTPSWSFSKIYPANFSGASLSLPGVYSVNVSESLPTSSANVVTGTFTVAITDSSSYQRTYPVGMQAGGYLPTDLVNVTITRSGNPVATLSTSRTADSNGLVTASWPTLPGTSTGNYTVAVVGKNTLPKAVPDTQQFMIYPTNITTTGFTTGTTSLERSETQGFRFDASYLAGQAATQASSMIRLTEPDGLTTHLVPASYNSTLGSYAAAFPVPMSAQTGTWTAYLDQKSLTDPYGNGGPLQTASSTFNVLPAILLVTLASPGTVFAVGDTLTIQATVVVPGGAVFNQGAVQSSMTLSGKQVGSHLSLTYDPTRGQWIGNYKITASDPSGTWLVTVSASDNYGNTGQSSVVESVNVSSAQSTSMLWSYIVIVLLLGVLGFIILITRKRGLSRREVKLDLTAIKTQADKVKGDDFLQSIHDQLQRKKKEAGLEKLDHD
ncbi:MAG TPA: hypothetical protein VGS11_02580 [Candidatus Bathyarchaeia archaeon]|nr:hypothetical protein [Candidatus Bathyarchaeia archaeon]